MLRSGCGSERSGRGNKAHFPALGKAGHPRMLDAVPHKGGCVPANGACDIPGWSGHLPSQASLQSGTRLRTSQARTPSPVSAAVMQSAVSGLPARLDPNPDSVRRAVAAPATLDRPRSRPSPTLHRPDSRPAISPARGGQLALAVRKERPSISGKSSCRELREPERLHFQALRMVPTSRSKDWELPGRQKGPGASGALLFFSLPALTEIEPIRRSWAGRSRKRGWVGSDAEVTGPSASPSGLRAAGR